MAMTLAEIRLKQNPILTSLLLGMGQGTYVAEKLFPRLPQALSSITLAQLGDERLRRYNLRRAPGAATKRVNIKFDGKSYTVDQYSVEVPLPRELLREADEARKLNVGIYAIGGGFASVASRMQGFIAEILAGLAKITFGDVSASFKAAADDMRISAEATMAASGALKEKSVEAFNSMAEGAQIARDGFAAVAKAASDTKPAADASSLAIANMAAQIEAAGQKATEAANATATAKQAVDDKKASDIAATTAIQQLRAEYTQLVAGGSLQAAAEKLQEINKALQGTPPAAKDAAKAAADAALMIEGAFQRLGVTSQAELAKTRDGAVRDYEILKNSGVASAMDIQNAFGVMAQKALDASGPIGSIGRATAEAALQAQAAAAGLAVQFDATGKAIVSAMGTGVSAVGGVTSAVSSLGNQVQTTNGRLDQQAEKFRQLIALKDRYGAPTGNAGKTSDGFDTNKDGSGKGTYTNNLVVADAFALVEKAKANKLTAADIEEAKFAFDQAQGALDYMFAMGKLNPGGQSNEFIQSTTALYNGARSAYEKVQDMVKAEQKKANAADASAATKSATPAASTSQTKTININLGGKTTSVTMATAADAANLESVLDQLAAAAARS